MRCALEARGLNRVVVRGGGTGKIWLRHGVFFFVTVSGWRYRVRDAPGRPRPGRRPNEDHEGWVRNGPAAYGARACWRGCDGGALNILIGDVGRVTNRPREFDEPCCAVQVRPLEVDGAVAGRPFQTRALFWRLSWYLPTHSTSLAGKEIIGAYGSRTDCH